MFFGITGNPSMYSQGEFGGVTQELGQHDGQTSPNGGENQIQMSFARISQTFYKIRIMFFSIEYFG